MNADSPQFGKQFLNWKPTPYKGDESKLGANHQPKVQGADWKPKADKPTRKTATTNTVDWGSL